MAERLCLLSVHAHPDDEASKGAATVARYHDEGVRSVLVTCTGGEEGDILNPAMDRPEVRADLPAVRRRELMNAAAAIGYDDVVLLGYRDSGMPDSPANARPDSFAAAPLAEAVGRLVEVIRRERPQVLVTYPEDQSQYPHPDHLRVHEISAAAFAAAGVADAYPGLGEPFQPLKLYYSLWPVEQVLARHAKFLELGLTSPYAERLADGWLDRTSAHEVTTRVDVAGYADARRAALLAHATQIDPDSPHWFGLPPEVERDLHVFDPYCLARSLVPTEVPEDDLFAGVREHAVGGPVA
jgi:mycothiol S-conjugate amidase